MAEVWKERAVQEAQIEDLVSLGYSRLQARLLALRGVNAKSEKLFFNPVVSSLLDSRALPGIAEATEIILDAIKAKKKIVVFGDYDCDGVCATSILVLALKALGASVVPFLPERLTEGYGLNKSSVDRLLKEHPGVSLVVTVDNGINSIEQVSELKDFGIDVIVTDHHLPGEKLPNCLIVNPKVSAPEEFDSLCGAGVAFLLAADLVARAKEIGMYGGQNIGGPLLVLAGLATVTDIMPLVGQNRILVSEALRYFRRWAPIGLRELMDRASRTTPAVLTAKDFGFLIGPRINAAGRMASAMEAIDLILSTNREEARNLARAIDLHNTERKSIEQKMIEAAQAQVVYGAPAQVIVLTSSDAHQGIGGIVAARILERLGKEAVPVIVIVGDHGSARSPEGYHIRNALQESSEALVRFGGHAAAGGLTIKEGCEEKLKALFCEACRKQAELISPEVKGATFADAIVTGEELTLEFARWLQKLEPFGEGNEQPTFLLRGVKLTDVRPLGIEGNHLQINFKNRIPRAVWWGKGDMVEELRKNSLRPYDLLVKIEVSTYGEPHAELRIQNLKLSYIA